MSTKGLTCLLDKSSEPWVSTLVRHIPLKSDPETSDLLTDSWAISLAWLMKTPKAACLKTDRTETVCELLFKMVVHSLESEVISNRIEVKAEVGQYDEDHAARFVRYHEFMQAYILEWAVMLLEGDKEAHSRAMGFLATSVDRFSLGVRAWNGPRTSLLILLRDKLAQLKECGPLSSRKKKANNSEQLANVIHIFAKNVDALLSYDVQYDFLKIQSGDSNYPPVDSPQ